MGTLKYKQTILAHLLAGAASWQLKITDLTLSDTIESQILAENYVWMNMPHIKVNYKLLIMKTEFKKQLGKKKKKKRTYTVNEIKQIIMKCLISLGVNKSFRAPKNTRDLKVSNTSSLC